MKSMIQPNIGGQMEGGVIEREKAERAGHFEKINSRHLSQRPDHKARQKEAQRPETEALFERPDRLRAKLIVQA